MKRQMNTELLSTLLIILICWIGLIAADTAISLIMKLLAGIPFRKTFLWGLISLAVPPAVIAYGALIERNCFMVRNIELSYQGLPDDFDGYKIVHISDIHARSFNGREKRLQKGMETINGLNPDMIAFTGDLITMEPEELHGIKSILSTLHARDGVFSVLGNHDYCMYSDMNEESKEKALNALIETEEAMGWTLLLDENRIISRGHDSVAVVGVENTSPSRHFPSRGDLTKAAAGTDGMFRILLTHDPLHWESEIVGQDYHLTLSGHTHAMQLSILGWCPSRYIFPQYRGLYSSDDLKSIKRGRASDNRIQYLHVNTGLGETIFPARIGVRPEITLITLKSPH